MLALPILYTIDTVTKQTKLCPDQLLGMSDLQEVRENFKRTQESLQGIPKVDPQLLIDMLLNEQKDPNNAPIYTLEVFMKKGTDLKR